MKQNYGYVRVSTVGQVQDGCSLAMQEAKIRAYASFYELELTDIIVDAGLSGKTVAGRPGMFKIVELIKSKKIQHFIVYKLDRMSRNLKEACELSELMKKNGVSLHSITEKIDTGSATGNLFFHMINAMSQWEREIISERTSAALQLKKSKGERVSCIPAYGFTHVDGMTVPDPHEQACIEHLITIRQANPEIGWKKAANLLHKAGYKNRNNCKFGTSSMRILFSLTCHFSVDISKAA